MTREEFEHVLEIQKLKKRYGRCKLKGFDIDFQDKFVKITGKLPLELVETVYNKNANDRLFINYHFDSSVSAYEVSQSEEIEELLEKKPYTDDEIAKLKKATPRDQLYLYFIITHTESGLNLIINTIRQMPYINEWAIGNY